MNELTKNQQRVGNIKQAEAIRHLRELKQFAARNLIKVCGGDMTSALNALVKAYGYEYGNNAVKGA